MFPGISRISAKHEPKRTFDVMAHTSPVDRDNTIDCLRILAKREPARQDKGVKMFIENIEQEKTSKERLSKEILTPLFIHISSNQH